MASSIHDTKPIINFESMEPCLRAEFDSLAACKKAWHLSHDHLTKFASAYCPQNMCKNRYYNILPNEQSRVKLTPLAEGDGDYINANFVDDSSYIVTQAPLLNTMNDFWRMIWQEKCPVIVCLTKMSEGECNKANKYWPEDGKALQFGQVHVKHAMSVLYMNIVVRSFTIWIDGNADETMEVVHLHYEDWPDHGAPTSTQCIRTMAHLVTNLQERGTKNNGVSGPPVVHCSAGVGRAGAFVTIHIILSKMDKILNAFYNATSSATSFGIKDLVAELRKQREGLVQTVDQYVFVHRTIIDTLRTIKRNSLKKAADTTSLLSSACSSFCPFSSPSAPAHIPTPVPVTADDATSFPSRNSKEYGCNFLDVLSLRCSKEHNNDTAQVR